MTSQPTLSFDWDGQSSVASDRDVVDADASVLATTPVAAPASLAVAVAAPDVAQPATPARITPPHLSRVVADSTNKVAWLKARSRGITATDVARLTGTNALRAVMLDKLNGSGFTGNAYTDYGREREPHIAEWVRRNYAIRPSSQLFHAEGDRRHLATPDGIRVTASGTVELAEIKTTNKAWRSIPRNYLRQVWWQQYVLGAERTLVVWEQHEGFIPLGEPESRWVDRDENEIAQLVSLADQLIRMLAKA